MLTKFPRHVPHKLHMVRLIRSGIRRPYWEKRILKKLGLVTLKKTVVLKNTPDVNKDLELIKELIEIRPVVLTQETPDHETTQRRVDLQELSSIAGDLKLLSAPFLDENGNFSVKAYQEYLESFPEQELNEVLSKNHKRDTHLLNFDFELEEEKKITDKGQKIGLYFKKKTDKVIPNRVVNRLRNISKY